MTIENHSNPFKGNNSDAIMLEAHHILQGISFENK